MSAGFKQGWNTFVVSVANQKLRWHLEKFTGRSASLFDTKTAYYMSDAAGSSGNPVRAANDVNEWGTASADTIIFVGFPYWIYIDSTDISGNFLQYPLGWDVYYPNNIASSSTALSNQSTVYGDKFVNNSRGYLQLNRQYGNNNSEYFFELRRGNAYFSHKLCIGGDNSTDDGIFRCYTTNKAANQYVEIIKQVTAATDYGTSSGTINLNIYDYGNPNPDNGPKINFFNKNFTSDTSNNQFLGELNFWGNKDNNHVLAGSIGIKQNGNFGSSICSAPADMIFKLGNGSNNLAQERLRITRDGDVGIGTTSPSQKLHVDGRIKAANLMIGDSTDTSRFISCIDSTMSSEGTKYITFGKSNNTGNQAEISFYYQGFGSSDNRLSLGFYGSRAMSIKHSGNVGIGTDNPTEKLTVYSGLNKDVSASIISGNENKDAILYFGTPSHSASAGTKVAKLGAAIIAEGQSSWSRSKLHFCLNNDSKNEDDHDDYTARLGRDEVMTLTPDGRVGIGTTNPDTDNKLHVDGNIKCSKITVTDISCQALTVGNAIITSDNRYKHNQKEIKNALSTLEKLNPKVYLKTSNAYETNQVFDLNSDGLPINDSGDLIKHIYEAGLIAQDIQNIDELKKFVSGTERLGLNYNSIFSYMVAALKELNQKYKDEKSKVSSLEAQMKNVLERLSNLEK